MLSFSCGTLFAEELWQRAVRYPYDKSLKAAAGDLVPQGYVPLGYLSSTEVEAPRRREFDKPRLGVRSPEKEHQPGSYSHDAFMYGIRALRAAATVGKLPWVTVDCVPCTKHLCLR